MDIFLGLIFGVVITCFYNIVCIHRKVNEILDYVKNLKD